MNKYFINNYHTTYGRVNEEIYQDMGFWRSFTKRALKEGIALIQANYSL